MAYKFTFTTLGGNTRVLISKGEDLRHLGELDEKMWTVLSCPTTGLEIPEDTLKLIDTDKDGQIRIDEVIAAANKLCALVKNPDILLDGKAEMKVDDLSDSADAQQMAEVAKAVADKEPVITLAAVEAKVASIAVDQKPLPKAPFADDIIAAVHEDEAAYDAWFRASELEKMGLAAADPEQQPKIKEADWKKMKAAIAAYEAEVAQINADNAAALEVATGKYQPLIQFLKIKRDFYTLIRNYVSFQDFYNPKTYAAFQAGRLVIDQRACELCVRVADTPKMGLEAGASGMYLLFCDCVNKNQGKKLSIVAAVTQGDIHNLAVGKNAIFYDRDGLDYDAVVTKIIDNPISIRQAFWTPYRKLANWISERINKSVAEKEAKSVDNLKASTEKAELAATNGEKPAAPSFDIAKFAGIFAAIGMGLGMIASALAAVAAGIAATAWWKTLLIIAIILLCISGPSMLLAYFKLRRRNLAPILNANGWAVNAEAIINVPFGVTLTSMAKFPLIKNNDPFRDKSLPVWAKCLICLGCIAIIALVIWLLFHFGVLGGHAVAEASAEVVKDTVATVL